MKTIYIFIVRVSWKMISSIVAFLQCAVFTQSRIAIRKNASQFTEKQIFSNKPNCKKFLHCLHGNMVFDSQGDRSCLCCHCSACWLDLPGCQIENNVKCHFSVHNYFQISLILINLLANRKAEPEGDGPEAKIASALVMGTTRACVNSAQSYRERWSLIFCLVLVVVVPLQLGQFWE